MVPVVPCAITTHGAFPVTPIGRYSQPPHRCPPEGNDTSTRVAMPTISPQGPHLPVNGQLPSRPVPKARVLRPLPTRSRWLR